eukprot:GILJ01023650.1.p1 GENE.GILJ01023650.1~~GILJ01023650.1.p1  ORF type:complete len:619 (-),score=38.17 GILJ01023650.1:61-1917(-)
MITHKRMDWITWFSNLVLGHPRTSKTIDYDETIKQIRRGILNQVQWREDEDKELIDGEAITDRTTFQDQTDSMQLQAMLAQDLRHRQLTMRVLRSFLKHAGGSPCQWSRYLVDIDVLPRSSSSCAVAMFCSLSPRLRLRLAVPQVDPFLMVKAFPLIEKDNSRDVEIAIYKHVVTKLVGYSPHFMLYGTDYICSSTVLMDQMQPDMVHKFNKTLVKTLVAYRQLSPSNDFQQDDDATRDDHDGDQISIAMHCLVVERGKGMFFSQWVGVWGQSASPADWVSILYQLMHSVECMRRMGIQHNDLHLGNIWLDETPHAKPLHYRLPSGDIVKMPIPWLVKIYDFDRSSAVSWHKVPSNVTLTTAGCCSVNGQCPYYSPKIDLSAVVMSLFAKGDSVPRYIQRWLNQYADFDSLFDHVLRKRERGEMVTFIHLRKPNGNIPTVIPDSHCRPIADWILGLLSLTDIDQHGVEQYVEISGLLLFGQRAPKKVIVYELPPDDMWIRRSINYIETVLLHRGDDTNNDGRYAVDEFLRNLMIELRYSALSNHLHIVDDSFPIDITNDNLLKEYGNVLQRHRGDPLVDLMITITTLVLNQKITNLDLDHVVAQLKKVDFSLVQGYNN